METGKVTLYCIRHVNLQDNNKDISNSPNDDAKAIIEDYLDNTENTRYSTVTAKTSLLSDTTNVYKTIVSFTLTEGDARTFLERLKEAGNDAEEEEQLISVTNEWKIYLTKEAALLYIPRPKDFCIGQFVISFSLLKPKVSEANLREYIQKRYDNSSRLDFKNKLIIKREGMNCWSWEKQLDYYDRLINTPAGRGLILEWEHEGCNHEENCGSFNNCKHDLIKLSKKMPTVTHLVIDMRPYKDIRKLRDFMSQYISNRVWLQEVKYNGEKEKMYLVLGKYVKYDPEIVIDILKNDMAIEFGLKE